MPVNELARYMWGGFMINKFRRKLAKWIAPKPVPRKKSVKLSEEYFPYLDAIKAVESALNDKSYQKNIRRKTADNLVGE